ncbi:MAG: asparagine synthase (glutamine-hydrolyzing) [Sphingomonadales bacterium]
MISESGRYVIVYNGEVYNHRDLRIELENIGAAPAWRGHSDTEILLAAIVQWGVRQTLERLNGMFAFALWDQKDRTLTLARDRMGEKPLYYGLAGNTFLFGSELKSLKAHPAFREEVDRNALALYLRHNYIPAPYSIWCGVRKLPPAQYVVIDCGSATMPEPRCYWDFDAAARLGAAAPLADDSSLVDALEVLLKDAVKRRMEADVPLGAFLSGGIDSSVIVALMQAQSARPVKTFSIGFHEQGYDEAMHAKAVAAHLGTAHTELYVTPSDALAVIPKIPTIWDEPFADSSQIPTFLVSEMTRQHVTVSLSGDGGDELFGGYDRYFRAAKFWSVLCQIPPMMRPLIASVLGGPVALGMGKLVDRVVKGKGRGLHVADRLPKLAALFKHHSHESLYLSLISHWQQPDQVVRGVEGPVTNLGANRAPFNDFRQTMMYLDTLSYLPDDILVKVDRATMAVSLEGRIPFLDHRVVEFAWTLPMSMKIRGTTGKHILREVLYRHVPKSVMDRPKMGFGVPIDSWLKGPLREWAEALLDEKRLREDGFFDPATIRRKWNEYQYGGRRWHYHLWDILMFQAWHDGQVQGATADVLGRVASTGA